MAEKREDGNLMDKLVALCRRRGFIFQSSEIYGGINGFWDYGPLGVELKRNIKDAWWTDLVRRRDDMVGLDCSIIMNPKVWEASGHVGGFDDPMVDCRECKCRFRADRIFCIHVLSEPEWKRGQLARKVEEAVPTLTVSGTLPTTLDAAIEADSLESASELCAEAVANSAKANNIAALKKCQKTGVSRPEAEVWVVHLESKSGERYAGILVALPSAGEDSDRPCPRCYARNSLTRIRQFNLMFETHAGALQDGASRAYLRPETAQGIFANYRNVLDSTRVKLPFGIAQIGKAFRNEINPRNFTFRSREFEQMEIEYFCRPEEADEWYEYWRKERFNWYVGLGLTSAKLRLRDHAAGELAHYAAACADIEYAFPFGVAELEGVANRTDFDLTEHQKASGKDMKYFDEETKERFIPYVIEPSGGVDRAALAFLCEAYTEDEAPDEKGRMQPRTLMKLHPRLAPIKVAVFPLVKKQGMPQIARGIHEAAQGAGLACFYDEKGAIGRRYRRQDEAGTPFCVTVDGQTLEDQTVTIRQRDTLVQERIDASAVPGYLREKLSTV